MSNADTVTAIRTNMLAAIAAHGNVLQERVAADEKNVPVLGKPTLVVLYTGSDFENGVGEKPMYDNAHFEIVVRFMNATLEGLGNQLAKTLHDIKSAVTVNTLNAGDLALTMLVSRVTATKPNVDAKPPLVEAKMPFIVRFREV